MKKFVIVSDSCCELTEELREKYDVEYLPMYISYEDKSVQADLEWKELFASDFYNILRSGTRIFTSQVPVGDYLERFEAYAKAGYDILSISCSSALSSSVKASMVARDEVKQKYPNTEIICIDSLICSFGLGLLCIHASNLRAQGKTIHEVADEIESFKMKVNQLGTVDELQFLKRAGRISASKALLGMVLNVKPIIISNHKGENVSTEKAKGRCNSMRRLTELTKEQYTGEKVKDIFIAHGDCLQDAEKVKAMLLEKFPDVNITIGMLNAAMGASCGPKTLIVYFVGQEKQNTEEIQKAAG